MPYDWSHTAIMNNIRDLLTRLVDPASRLINGLTEINEEPQNVSQEAAQDNSTGVPDDGGNILSISATRSEIQHMENLPDDLLINIFIRLPAKQLVQLRCVSKSWSALLSQSSFAKSHLHHSINNNDRILFAFYDNESSSSDPKPFTSHPSRSPHLELTNFIKLPKSGDTTSRIIIIGSIHGLICSHYGYDVIHIWNPSLSAVSTLPPHHIPSRCSYEIYFRFGFDPKTEDYKVVKIIGLTDTLADVVKEWLQVEVYSMKKGSWEFITQRFPSHITNISDDDFVCVDGHDGHLHWHGYVDKIEEGELETIVAFDLGSETFCEIPFPDPILDEKRLKVLGVLGGKLCVMSWYKGNDVFEVWVMDEYGVAQSWIKHHFFSQFIDKVVCGFTSHNEIVMVNADFHNVLYDPISDKAKFLEKNCHGSNSVKIVEYIDSLVWVACVQHEFVDGAGEHGD